MKLDELMLGVPTGSKMKTGSILELYGQQEAEIAEQFFLTTTWKVTSLVGGPQYARDNYDCETQLLTDLKGAPVEVNGRFTCAHNQITSLEGAPKHLTDCGNFGNNKLTSLQGIHKQILSVEGYLNFKQNPIKSHVLGLLKIKNLQRVMFDDDTLTKIINKHIKNGRNIFDCQAELEDVGLEEYAQL